MNLLHRAANLITDVRERSLSDVVLYTRKSVVTDHELNAAAAQGSFFVIENGNINTRVYMRDFIIPTRGFIDPPADSASDATGIVERPERGDVIRASIDGVTHEYEVTSPPDGSSCWEWTDAHHTSVRVHTIRTGGGQ